LERFVKNYDYDLTENQSQQPTENMPQVQASYVPSNS
jgi:hypothetical protein